MATHPAISAPDLEEVLQLGLEDGRLLEQVAVGEAWRHLLSGGVPVAVPLVIMRGRNSNDNIVQWNVTSTYVIFVNTDGNPEVWNRRISSAISRRFGTSLHTRLLPAVKYKNRG